MSADSWPVVLGLGIWHGINPGMGWLFAVALGLQERRARAVWRALPPLAIGHGVAIAAAIVLASAAGRVVPIGAVRGATAVILVAAGLYRLRRHGHVRYGGMQMNAGTLAIWSALMASAHGAGLMVLPFVMGALGTDAAAAPAGHAAHLASLAPSGAGPALGATAVHTAGYLLTAGLIAVVVYERIGLRFLRRLWVNLDLVWAAALILTGLATPWL